MAEKKTEIVAVETTTEQEEALLEVLRFKVTHASAVTRIIGKHRKIEANDAESGINDFVKTLIAVGYSRQRVESLICRYWRYAEDVYNERKVEEFVL